MLLHGLTATRRNVVQGSRLLARQGFRLIGYDARGHGESDPAPDAARLRVPGAGGGSRGRCSDEVGIERPRAGGQLHGGGHGDGVRPRRPGAGRALVQITPAYDGGSRGADDAGRTGTRWPRRSSAGDIEAFVERSGVE